MAIYQKTQIKLKFMENYGGKKVSSCVIISGKGSNLLQLIKSSLGSSFPIKINLVISDKKKAFGLKYAKKYNIPFKVYNSSNQKKFEKSVLKELKKRKINFLCLAGFMKILSGSFIKNFQKKIVNIHPSLLPKYKGLNTHIRALSNNEKFSGCTVHYVTQKLDSGKIILQSRVKIKKNETASSLKKKILLKEHKIYSKAIRLIFN